MLFQVDHRFKKTSHTWHILAIFNLSCFIGRETLFHHHLSQWGNDLKGTKHKRDNKERIQTLADSHDYSNILLFHFEKPNKTPAS